MQRYFPTLERHVVDLVLGFMTVVSTVLMLISSSDPVPDALKGSWLHKLLAQFPTGNQITFDLSVAVVAGVLMYGLVVRLPEIQRRRRLRRHLLKTYQMFKLEVTAIYLGRIQTSYAAKLPEELSEPAAFKKYFQAPFSQGQDRWHGVANALDEDTIERIVTELEILRQELLFVTGAVDIADEHALGVLRRLSQVVISARLWSTDYDDVKSMMRFLWSLHTGWNFITGYPQEEPFVTIARSI